jgi:hypothetical protein
MNTEYFHTVATESELDDLLEGREVGITFPWPSHHTLRQLPPGSTGVVWKKGSYPGDPIQPIILVAHEEDLRRLCGRFAQLRSDLSPLTAWCHLFTPKRFEMLKSARLVPDFRGLQAAWSGLVVAEAQILSEVPLANLRFPACLATQTFAIGRASALWGDVSESEMVRRFNTANKLFKTDSAAQQSRAGKVRSALQPIWATLNAFSRGLRETGELRPLVDSLEGLQDARQRKDRDEGERFARPLVEVIPEARDLFHLSEIPPEQRLGIFDQIVGVLNKLNMVEPSLQRSALAMVAGYLATVAAGGSPTLTLAANLTPQWPEIMAWAYVVGGIGERVFWTSSFDGLGRLVARELMRPLTVDESPACDFALDEATVLVDSKLKDPLVHLRIKQAKLATVALLPGVNVVNSINGLPPPNTKPQRAQPNRPLELPRDNRGLLGTIADSIWPYLRPRVEECIRSAHDDNFESSNDSRTRNRRTPPPSQLNLRGRK